MFTTDTKGRPLSTTYTDNTCQTGCFTGEAFLNWDPCGSLTSMTAANGTLVASYEYDKAYSKKINEYNPHAIEMPFQYNGRDGTVTPTYGGATPLNIGIQVNSGSSINVSNQTPLLANSKFQCRIDGGSDEWPTSPVDGGADDDCDDGDECDPCPHVKGKYYSDDQGEWDEAGYISGWEFGKNSYNCNENLNDYRHMQCLWQYYKKKGYLEEAKKCAWRARFATCIGKWAGCKWTTAPEASDEYSYDRASDAKGVKNPGHGAVHGPSWEDFEKCEEYASS